MTVTLYSYVRANFKGLVFSRILIELNNEGRSAGNSKEESIVREYASILDSALKRELGGRLAAVNNHSNSSITVVNIKHITACNFISALALTVYVRMLVIGIFCTAYGAIATNKAVAECRINNSATYGTGLCGSTVSSCTGSMTICCNNFLCNLVVTSGAVRAFGKTGFSTGRCNCSIGDHIVIECVNYFLCNENFVTYGAVLAFCLTCSSTSSSYRLVNNLGVPLCCNNFLCNENFVTYGAVLTFCLTCSSTSSSYCLINNFGVTLCCNYFLCNENFVTYGAVLTFGKTGFGTSCILCRVNRLGMSKFVDSLFGSAELFATYRTLNYFIIRTCSLTGSINYILLNCCCRGMSKLVDSLFGSAELFATYRTVNYFFIRTCSLTGSGNYVLLSRFACGVRKLSSFCLCNENCFTNGAVLTFGKTGCSTSCSYCLINYLGVRKLVDSLFSSAELFATYRALNYFIIRTCSLTGSGNYVFLSRFARGVRKLSSFCLCNENCFTNGAVLTFGKTGCSTSCSYCLINYLGVRKLVDSLFSSAELFATYRALNYFFIRTFCGASSINYVFLNCISRSMFTLGLARTYRNKN